MSYLLENATPPRSALNTGIYAVTPQQAEAEAASLNNPFEAGVKSSIRGTIGGVKGLVAGIQDAYGADPSAMYLAAQDDARRAAVLAPPIASYRDVRGLGDAASYALGEFGKMVPFVALGGTGSVAGRGLNAATRLGMAPEVAAHLGGMAAFTPSMAGEQIMQMHENAPAMSATERLQRGLVTGAGQAVAGAAIPRLLTRAPVPTNLLTGAATSVGTGAAGMVGMDVVGQANRMDYDPAYQFDPQQTLDSAVAGAVGTAPLAVPHVVAGKVAQAGKQAAEAAVPAAQGAGDVVGAGLQKTGEAIKEVVDTVKQAAGEFAEDPAVAVGAAAGKATKAFETAVKHVAETTIPEMADKLRSGESRLHRTIEELASDPSDDLMRKLPEREAFFRVMEQTYGNGEHGRMMREAADAIAALSGDTAMDNTGITEQWGKVTAAATRLRLDLGADVHREARTKLAKWLDKNDVKYSRLGLPDSAKVDLVNANDYMVDDSLVADALHRAFARTNMGAAVSSGERSEITNTVRKTTQALMRGETFPEGTGEAFRDYLGTTFGSEAGKLEGAIYDAVKDARTGGNEKELVTGKTSLYDFIAGNMKTKGPTKGALVTDLIAHVREADQAVRTVEGRKTFDLNNLPEAIRNTVQEREAIRAEMGLPPRTDQRALALEEIDNTLDNYLRKHLSGSPEPVKQAIRDMDEALYGSTRRRLGTNGGRAEVAPAKVEDGREADVNDLGSEGYDAELAQVGDREGYDAEGKRVQDNGLSLVPEASERTVHDQDLPLSGHTTAEHGQHGELGWAKRELQKQSGDHVDIDHANVLTHVSRMSREPGETDDMLLTRLHAGVTEKARQHALDLREELASNGIDADEYLGHLQKEYNAAAKQQKDAKLSRQPQEFFDAAAALKPYGLNEHQAQQLSDLFWSEVKRDWKGKSGREFFERFGHSYPTTRNRAGSHERLDFYDLSRGVITDAKFGTRKDRGTGVESGVLSVATKDGTPTYLDLPKLIAHSLGKVRSRTETIDEMGRVERYEPTDGDLRTAFANIALSLIDSPEFTLTPETARVLLNPPADLKLTADVAGRGEDAVQGKTWGEVTKTTPPVKFTSKQRREIILPAEGVKPGLASLSKGILTGGSKPVTAGGEPVAIDVQAAIREAAKQFKVDLTTAPRSAHYALLTEVIRRLRDSGAVDKESLPMPTNAFGVLNAAYERLVIGDKSYRNERGELVKGAEDTQVVLTRASQATTKALVKATRLDLDANRMAIDGLAGLGSALKVALEQRARDSVDPVLKTDIKNLEAKRGALADAAADKRSKGLSDKDEVKQLHAVNAELDAKMRAAQKSSIDMTTRGEDSAGEVARLARDEREDYERNGAPNERENLDGLSTGEVKAKLENVMAKLESLAGREDVDFIPDDGLTGAHERVSPKLMTEVKRSGAEDAFPGTHKIAETHRGERLVPVSKEDRERATVGKQRPGELPVEDHALLKALTQPAEKVAASAEEAPRTRKADPNLQRLITDLSANKRGDITSVKPEMIKTWMDEAGKINTEAAREFERRLKGYAEIEGVDPATGQYRTDEIVKTRSVEDVDGARVGEASLRLNGRDMDIVQNGKVVGTLLNAAKAYDPAKTAVALVKSGSAFEARLTTRGEAKEMSAYEGGGDVPLPRTKFALPRERIAAGEPQKFKAGSYAPTKKFTGEIDSGGRASELRYNDVAYSPERFKEVFGADTLAAAENVLQKLAKGQEPYGHDLAKLGVPRMNDLKRNAGKRNLGNSLDTPKFSRITLRDGTTFDGESAVEVRDTVNRMFNGDFTRIHDQLLDTEGRPVGGKIAADKATPLGFMVHLSMQAKGMLGSNGFHEALHGLYRVLGSSEAGKASLEKLTKSLTGEVMQERLNALLDKLPLTKEDREAIRKDMAADPEEAAAYAFQFWATGQLKLGNVGEGFFAKIARTIRGLLGVTREYERTEAFMDAFVRGDLGKADFKPSALERAFAEQRGDKAMQVIKQHLEPFNRIMREVFDSSVKSMERLNIPAATTLMKKYAGYGQNEGFIKRVRIESHIHATAADRILNAHTPEELSTGLREVYAGKVTTRAGAAMKEFIDRMQAVAGRTGQEPPTIWDYEKIGKNREAFDAAINDFGVRKEGKKNAAVLDLLSDMGYSVPGEKGTFIDFLPQYGDERAKWIQTDARKYMRSLITSAVKTSERNRIFKPGEVNTLLDTIRRDGGDDAYYQARRFVDGMEGRLGHDMNPAVRNMMKGVLTVGNVVTLPFALFSAAVDPFHLASRSNNLGDAASAYMAGLGSVVRTLGEGLGVKHKNSAAENFAEDIGAIEHAMMTDVLGDVYLGDQAEGMTKRVNDWFFRANMLDGWTRQMRVAAVTAGKRFIMEHAKLEGKHSQRFMDQLGLKPSDVKVDASGNLEVNDAVKMALNKFVDESIVRPDAATNANWMNDPRFMLLAHMKRFTFAFNDVVMNRAVDEATEGNFSPIAMLGASIPAILMADGVKHLLKGDWAEWTGTHAGNWFDYGMNRSGLNGKLQFGLDAVEDVQRGGTPFDSALGPDIGLVKRFLGHPTAAAAGGDGSLLGLADDAFFIGRGLTAAKALKKP